MVLDPLRGPLQHPMYQRLANCPCFGNRFGDKISSAAARPGQRDVHLAPGRCTLALSWRGSVDLTQLSPELSLRSRWFLATAVGPGV